MPATKATAKLSRIALSQVGLVKRSWYSSDHAPDGKEMNRLGVNEIGMMVSGMTRKAITR